MRKILFLGVVLPLLGLVACPTGTMSTGTTIHVYIGGAVGTSSSSTVPVYWKDGVLNYLPLSNGNTNGFAFAIAVDSTGNVYVAGGQGSQIGYWRVSTFTALSLGTYSVVNGPFSIAVDTNGNVWIGGAEVGTTTPNTFVYWKNSGGPNVLAGSPTAAWGIRADTSGDVYFTGTETISSNTLPYYWKNGANPTALTLSGGNPQGYPAQLTVDSSGNLYICGIQWGDTNGGPFYWKTLLGIWSSATTLPVGPYDPNAYWNNSSVAVDSSGNLYFVGATGTSSPTTPLYWKGASSTPTAMSLPNGTSVFDIWSGSAAFDANGNFIVAGTVGNTQPGSPGSLITDGVPIYWQNGSPINLPMGSGNAWGQAALVAVGP